MLNIRVRKSVKILNAIIDLPTPINIRRWWNFGSLLGLVLSVQILRGLFLSIHYTANVQLAFDSVRHIIRDVNGGWLIRTLHANGASLFFICIYAHIGRGLYYGRYSYKGTWLTGVILLVLVMASAFLGYVLPWGQIRFWGATVITNLFRAFPYFGDDLVNWLWGGYSVDNATLTRFYTFHFVTPLLVASLVVLHIILLHNTGSNNPLGVISSADKIPFHWYFTIKDLVGFVVMLAVLVGLLLFRPYLLGEPDNFIVANPMNTPAHIVPEWYFLFAYAILRSVPNKLGGVVGLFGSILMLILLPFLNNNTLKGSAFYPLSKALHWIFVMVFVILTLGGSWPVEEPYISSRRFFSMIYFCYFVVRQPLRIIWDKIIYYRQSIIIRWF